MKITKNTIKRARALKSAGESLKEFARTVGVSYWELIKRMKKENKDG